MNKHIKTIIISLIILSIIIQSSILVVSANFVTMLDYGFGIKNGSNYNWQVESGSTITGTYPMVYWAIDSFDPDYTYTFTFRFTSTTTISNYYNPNVYITTKRLEYIDSNINTPVSVYSILERDGNNYAVIVKLNFGLLDITKWPAFISAQIIQASEITTTINGWSVSAEYDPGGSKYIEEYLDQIVNAGSGYPVPDGTNLDNSVNSLNSAEGVVKDKSSSLIDSVSSEMSDNILQATVLSNNLKPAVAQINNIYTSFLSVLPSEVKAIFIAIPLLLFIGWLIGRVRE